ncbi:MAG: S41 family peptidase [Corynebacterium sp.]|uniref:S41 family peptidase n=1 Tax=Corynebacterium sp. TaxID=1720 RepID=UPI0026DEEBB8|nr:S41 family peptidase [Corynebacterium sp.]MDO5668994.1 S41 family peptidase [Corynebacterium sp.]
MSSLPWSYADALAAGLSQPGCGAVVDLRGNTDGDIAPMLAGVSPLLDDGVVLQFVSRHGTSDVRVEGTTVTEPGGATTTTGGQNPLPVALLTDGETASAAEAVLLSFAGLDRAISFGAPTAGYASQNTGFDINVGGVIITTALMRDRTRREHAYNPIVPEVDTADPQAAALDWLAAAHGCSTS